MGCLGAVPLIFKKMHQMKKIISLVGIFLGFSLLAKSQAPANDNCAGALAITCGAVISANTTNATNDVLPAVFCGSTSSGFYSGVWYKYVALTSGPVALRTCGTNWDTYLRVYSGVCGTLNTCVVYNDDACERASELTFDAISGTTYYILLAGYYSYSYGQFTLQLECASTCITPSIKNVYVNTDSSVDVVFVATGTYVIEYGLTGFTPGTGASAGGGTGVITTSNSVTGISGLQPNTTYDVYLRKQCTDNPVTFSANSVASTFTTLHAPPPNDECSTAVEISTVPLAATIVAATQSLSPVYCISGQSTVANDAWFRFTSTGNEFTHIRVKNAPDFDAVIQLYTGNCSNLTEISCADFSGYGLDESLGFSPTAGEDYYVRVYSNDYYTGDFSISLCKGQLTLVSGSTGFCNSSSVTLTAGNAVGPYRWYRNNVLLSNQASQVITVSEPGSYFAEVTMGNCDVASNVIELSAPLVQPSLGGTGVYNDYESVNVGIPLTESDQTYSWRKAGTLVYGPLNGNGSNQSFQFNMTETDAGVFIVESLRPGCSSVYSNQVFVYYGGVSALRLDNCPYDHVDFSWHNYNNPVARFQYAVTTSEYPPASGTETFGTNASVPNLQPGTAYYLHVRGASFSFLDMNAYSYNNSNWVTMAFTTEPTAVAGSCEWTGSIDTDWFNAGNWRCSLVPGQYSNVVIPSGKARYPVLNTSTTVKSLVINTGAAVNLQGGVILNITNQ
jgi:hypothetical protein